MSYVVFIIAVLLVGGVQARSEEPSVAAAAVISLTEGVVYRVAQLNDHQLAAETAPTLTLDKEEGRVSGFSGVNRYGGGYTLTAHQLTCGQMMSTRMAGDEQAMAIEQEFLQLTGGPLTITATTAGVELRNSTGFMRLVPQTK